MNNASNSVINQPLMSVKANSLSSIPTLGLEKQQILNITTNNQCIK